MTKDKFKEWVKPYLREIPLRSKRILMETVELADRLNSPGSGVNHHIETSINNKNAMNLIKAVHVFRYPYFDRTKSSQDFIQASVLLNFVKKINNLLNSNFNLDLLKVILSIPVSKGTKNDIIVFYAAYNRRYNNLSKLSFHINPDKTPWLSYVLHELQDNNRKGIANYISKESIEFLGFDFFRNGGYDLKIYQRFDCLPRDIPFIGRQGKRILNDLDCLRPKKNILFMHRFYSGKFLFSAPGIYLYHGNNPDCQSFLNLKSLKPYRNFIKKISSHINIFKIIWIALKGNRLEFYFR